MFGGMTYVGNPVKCVRHHDIQHQKQNLLIIGGTSGISIETAKTFAKNNFNIIICSRNLEKLEVIAKEIEEEYKCKCDFFFFDINNESNHLELLNNLKVFPDVILFSIGMMSNQPKDDLNIEKTKMIVRRMKNHKKIAGKKTSPVKQNMKRASPQKLTIQSVCSKSQ